MQLDIDDPHRNFGDKYDSGINQALAYVQNHESELKQKFMEAVEAKVTKKSPYFFRGTKVLKVNLQALNLSNGGL